MDENLQKTTIRENAVHTQGQDDKEKFKRGSQQILGEHVRKSSLTHPKGLETP